MQKKIVQKYLRRKFCYLLLNTYHISSLVWLGSCQWYGGMPPLTLTLVTSDLDIKGHRCQGQMSPRSRSDGAYHQYEPNHTKLLIMLYMMKNTTDLFVS